MRCPSCGCEDDKVLESRAARNGVAIRRRRQCLKCGYRFTTYEEILRDSMLVLKRDGSKQELSRQKIMDGILRACRKRPVTSETMEQIADKVIEAVEKKYEREIPASAIGEQVMEELSHIDEVAYIRFASVYKRFESAEQFLKEIQQISGISPEKA